MTITRLLEEAPGVQSIARWVALVLTGLTALAVMACLWIAAYAVVHAKDHEQQAALAINSAGQVIQTIGTFVLLPVIGGIWIALGLRKKSPDPGAQQTRVTVDAPANAQPSMSITPTAGSG